MDTENWWRLTLAGQLGAALSMLERAIEACPEDAWAEPGPPEWRERGLVGFWYVAFHTIFFLDYYLSESANGFEPPPPFTLIELDPQGLLPDQPYSKGELLEYACHCRRKMEQALAALTDQVAALPCGFPGRSLTRGALMLQNLRHLQHHTGQLHLVLRQVAGSTPGWISEAPPPRA